MDLAALETIRTLKYRYLRALDLKLWDEFADTFTEEATGDYGSPSGGQPLQFTGRDAIVGYMRSSLSADIISVHVPLTEQTRSLIGRREFGLMRDGVVLVNTARGAVVDERELYRALVCGKVAACGLDVFENEPPGDSPLLTLPNVVASPHNGGYSDVITNLTALTAARRLIAGVAGAAEDEAAKTPRAPALPPQ